MTSFLNCFYQSLHPGEPGNEEYLRHLAELMVIQLFNDHPNELKRRWIGRSRTALTDPCLERAVTYLTAHYNAPLRMAWLAKEVGVGRATLCQAFKRAYRQTPNDYLQALRVKKAIEFFQRHPHASVAQAAEAVGYREARSLQKAFAAHARAAPSTFR